jgi:hypothetical protein
MAVEKKAEKEVAAPVSEREQLWAEFLANYKAKNPVKFAAKEAAGAFKTIPASFIGKKVTKQRANGPALTQIF